MGSAYTNDGTSTTHIHCTKSKLNKFFRKGLLCNNEHSTDRHTLLGAAECDAYVQTEDVSLRLSALPWPAAHPHEPAAARHSSACTLMQLNTKSIDYNDIRYHRSTKMIQINLTALERYRYRYRYFHLSLH